MSLPQSSRTLLALCCAIALMGQAPPPQAPPVPVPPGFGPRLGPQQPPTQPQPQAPAQPPAAAPQEAAPAPRPSTGGLNLQNASLTEVVDILARQLRINYILDSRVRGGVVLNTYGEVKQIDTRALLDSILRINGAAMVQVGDLYRIVPLSDVARLPVQPRVNAQNIPDSDQAMLNLIFLKYVAVEELSKLLDPFVGEHGKTWAYSPANLLLILDSSRNMKRLMELVALFDNDALASQRVRLFDVKNGRPSDIAKELETIIKSISLNEKTAPIKFLPVDRINMIIAVASNPGAFDEVAKWVEKLDTEVKVTAGTVDNFVYRVKYGRAEMLATAIMALYGGFGGFGFGGMGGYGMGMGMGGYGMGGGMGGYGMGGGGMGGYGMGGGLGMGGYGMGGYGGYPGGGMYPGAYGGGAMPQGPGAAVPMNTPPSVTGGSVAVPPGAGTDLTGQYLGLGGGLGPQARIPRVIPNPMDNTLLIQATQKEYEGILKILRDIDVSPRQVLIDAKIYEVSLTGAFASGVTAFLFNPQAGRPDSAPGRPFSASLVDGITTLTAGWLVSRSKELLGQLTLAENESTAKVISQPSIIATDSISASINVGTEVPTLTASVPTSVQTGGNSIFAQQIQSRNSGVSLSITARVNPSGIVTLQINQEVSSPIAPAAGSIQSPSFSKRTVQTQVTVQDGDTIAIGGIINESDTGASAGVPGVHKVPVLGFFFGNKSKSKERTELVIFMTPRVIYDTNEISDASDELKSRLRRLTKLIKE